MPTERCYCGDCGICNRVARGGSGVYTGPLTPWERGERRLRASLAYFESKRKSTASPGDLRKLARFSDQVEG